MYTTDFMITSLKANNLIHSIDPFPHLIIEPDVDIYEYAKSVYPYPSELKPGIRTNEDLTDERISTYLNGVVQTAYEQFEPVLQAEYPKMDFDSLEKRHRYLFSYNTPNQSTNIVRGLHLDNGTKIIVGLWYFKDPNDDAGGDLFLVNPLTKQSKTFEYAENKIILFPNIMTAWHAVTARKPTLNMRRFINIILESDTFLHSYNKTSIEEPREKVVNNFK